MIYAQYPKTKKKIVSIKKTRQMNTLITAIAISTILPKIFCKSPKIYSSKFQKGKINLFFPNLVFLTKMFHWTNSMKILRTLPNFPLRKRKIFCSILESKFKTKKAVRKTSFSLNYSSEHRESTFTKLASKKCVRNPKTFRSNPKTKKRKKTHSEKFP